jgi:hypothetical protein
MTMIRYALKCAEDHRFESWFQSASAFDALAARGHVACPVCGVRRWKRRSWRPAWPRPKRPPPSPRRQSRPAVPERPAQRPGASGRTDAAQAARTYREDIDRCRRPLRRPRRARCMLATRTRAPIHGQASPEEARALIEDGVPILPVPIPVPGKATDAGLAGGTIPMAASSSKSRASRSASSFDTEAATWRAMASGVMPSRRSLSTMDFPLGPSGCVKRSASSPS